MSNAVSSSNALSDLRNDLTQLSKALHVIYDLMNADMRQVGEAWQDSKYQEFVRDYQPQIQKCEEIANRYSDWCVKVLEPTIQNVVAVEMTDVSGGAFSVEGLGSAVIGGAAVTGTVVGGVVIANGFNLGSNNDSKPSTKAVPISNGCGSETDPKSFAAAKIGRLADAKLASAGQPWNEYSEWVAQGESCNIHDKCYYEGEGKEKCDIEFQQRSPIMGSAVRMAQETSGKSYAEAQMDRLKSQRLQPIWEEEHQQSLDANNYRVDIEEGGFSKI